MNEIAADKEAGSSSFEPNENEIILDKTLGGPDLLTDAFLEEEMERQPRKFTLECICGLFTIIATFFLCKWFSIRLVQSKSQDSQLDIMMKRQIMEGAAFKNCMAHYERNMCEQYGSEEEFMAMMRMKEQQRINMKMLMERERNERNESVNEGPDRMHSIMERSNESGSLMAPADRQQESSLLM